MANPHILQMVSVGTMVAEIKVFILFLSGIKISEESH
jgi:hypothetical protein